jgi:hypothetical protein
MQKRQTHNLGSSTHVTSVSCGYAMRVPGVALRSEAYLLPRRIAISRKW